MSDQGLGPRARLHPFNVVDAFRVINTRLRKLEGFYKPGWLNLPLAANMSANTFGFTPQYAIFPNRRIELRGNIAKSAAFSTGTTTVFTLPAEAAPTQIVDLPVALQAAGTNSYVGRLEIDAGGVGSLIIPSPFGGTWLSLDGKFFYQD